jgi:quercetin dioxygenase-like cupin family protein
VEFENAQVRVLRVTYPPNEKSVMHSHPNSVAIFLTGRQGKVYASRREDAGHDGESRHESMDRRHQASARERGDKPFELILVEMKGKAAGGKWDFFPWLWRRVSLSFRR